MPARIVNGLAQLVVKRRLFAIALVVLGAILLGSQIPRLKANFTPEDLFAQVEGQEEIDAAFRKAFGHTDNVVLVLVEAEDVLALGPLQYVHDVSRHFASDPAVARVSSITVTPVPRPADGPPAGESPSAFDFRQLVPRFQVDPVVQGDRVEPEEAEELRRALEDAPLLEGKLISHDRSVAAVALILDAEVRGNGPIAEAVERIAAWVEQNPPPDGVSALLAGLPYVRLVIVDKMRADQTLLLPAAIIVCLLILALSFRWPAAVLLSTVAVSLSAVMMVGGMALVGEPVNIINNIVPMLVLIIGISSAIHFVNRYGEEFQSTQSRAQASLRTLRAMLVALFMTSFTTAVGFGSLAVSVTPMLRRFGVTAAVGIMLAYVVSITLLPASLTFVHAPRRFKAWARRGLLERAIEAATRRVLRVRWPVLVGSAAVFAAAIYLATGLRVNAAVLDQLDEGDEIFRTSRLLERRLEGMRALEVSLASPREGRFDELDVLNAISAVQQWAEEQEGVLGTMSYAELLHEAWYRLTGDPSARQAVFGNPGLVDYLSDLMSRAGVHSPASAYVTEDRTRARLNIQVADMGSRQTLALIGAVQVRVDEAFGSLPEVEAALTGDAYVGSMGLTLVFRDLIGSLAAAFVIIFGFLVLVLRSWRLGLISLPPNLIPLVMTMAYMVVRGIPLNLATVIIFSVSIGMAVDGTIHVLARFREELRRVDDVDEAILRAARGTGKAILFTCLSLMLGFGVLLLSSFPPVRRFGELVAVTMGTCLLATLVMVPALLHVAFPSLKEARAITLEHAVEE
jgi:uncharacterized protein